MPTKSEIVEPCVFCRDTYETKEKGIIQTTSYTGDDPTDKTKETGREYKCTLGNNKCPILKIYSMAIDGHEARQILKKNQSRLNLIE